MAKEITPEAALSWLQANEGLLNISGIARRLNIDQSNLKKAIRGQADTHGTILKIPARCMPEMRKIMFELASR